jgi:hypothetical protein
MLNRRLAEHYGIPGVEGLTIRRVELPKDSPRGGVLTQGAVLKVTANGTNTSPVVRGVWVLDRILGTPAPPPPSGIPSVEPDIRGTTTLREQLAKHRSVPSCAGCHSKIDPPGFALENFDVIGGWRDRYRSLGAGDRGQVRGPLAARSESSTSWARRWTPRASWPEGPPFREIRTSKSCCCGTRTVLRPGWPGSCSPTRCGRGMGFSDRAEIDRIVAAVKPGTTASGA